MCIRDRYESEKIDVTMPAKRSKKGNLHPVTQVKDQLSEIFTSMGFEVYELSLIHIWEKFETSHDAELRLFYAARRILKEKLDGDVYKRQSLLITVSLLMCRALKKLNSANIRQSATSTTIIK